MKSLERLGEKLARFTGDVRPALQIFTPVDIKSVSDDLEIEARGKERGLAEQPSADENALDSVEQEIIGRIDEFQRQAYQTFVDEMRVYSERLRSLEIEQRVMEITVATRDAIAEFRSRVNTGRDELYTLVRSVQETETELKDFRSDHNLRRTAHPPESHTLHIGVIALILIAEATLNGKFLAKGLEGGLLAGIISALVIALLNVGFGLIFGYFSRHFGHRDTINKYVGALSVLAQITFVIIFNLFVAHYRDALASADPEEAVKLAVTLFKENPIGLKDFESWILAGMGVLFSWVAFIDGFKWDDPYPGYGTAFRKNQKAHDYFNADKQNLIHELTDIKDETSDTMASALKDMGSRKREYFDVVEYQKRLCEAFDGYCSQLENGLNQLVTIYRDANKAARSATTPVHFKNTLKLKRIAEVKPDTPPYTAQQVNALMKKAEQAIKESSDELFSEFEKAFTSFRDIEEIIHGGDHVAANASTDPT